MQRLAWLDRINICQSLPLLSSLYQRHHYDQLETIYTFIPVLANLPSPSNFCIKLMSRFEDCELKISRAGPPRTRPNLNQSISQNNLEYFHPEHFSVISLCYIMSATDCSILLLSSYLYLHLSCPSHSLPAAQSFTLVGGKLVMAVLELYLLPCEPSISIRLCYSSQRERL